MRRIASGLAMCFVVISCMAAAQQENSPAVQGGGAIDQTLQARFREYTEALKRHDVAALDKIWADDYTFINPQGALVSKAERMANVKSGATEFQDIASQRERLAVHGDVAVDVGRVTLKGTKYSGQEASGDYRYTNVWAKIQDRWQLVANQITRISK